MQIDQHRVRRQYLANQRPRLAAASEQILTLTSEKRDRSCRDDSTNCGNRHLRCRQTSNLAADHVASARLVKNRDTIDNLFNYLAINTHSS